MSCVIGVKAVFHHPTVPHFAGIIAAQDRRLMERSGPYRTGQGLEPSFAASTPAPAKSESERSTVAENLRLQRLGGHDKQGSGTRSGTHEGKAAITDPSLLRR